MIFGAKTVEASTGEAMNLRSRERFRFFFLREDRFVLSRLVLLGYNET